MAGGGCFAMSQARDVMTKEIAAVAPDTPVPEIAHLLLTRSVSAVPVIDGSGALLGMVSEGDLIGRSPSDREERRDWWLALLAEGETLHPDFLASLRKLTLRAQDVMSTPVVSVEETTEIDEIARLLASYRIKRVPVLREGKVVGIVSRADLLHSLAEGQAEGAKPQTATHGLLSDALTHLDQRFFGGHQQPQAQKPAPQPVEQGIGVTRADFQTLVADSEHRKAAQQASAKQEAIAQRRARVEALISHHIDDPNWRALLHQARLAAEAGEPEALLLRFPSGLCSDAGRSINAREDDWPATLRGEAAEVYLRWEKDLKPAGFGLVARVLDFPGGFPGDIGLFLVWGA